MSFLKRSSANSAPQSSSASRPDPKTAKFSVKQLILPVILVAIAGAMLSAPFEPHVLAKSEKQHEATPQAKPEEKEDSNIDPAAVDAVKKMGAYLRSLKAFQVIDLR